MTTTNKKCVLIGTFVRKQKILTFLEFLKDKFNINLDRVFVYSIDSNDKEYVVTFKVYNKEQYLKSIKYSTVMHVKNGCLFSINALNKLIDTKDGNVEHSQYMVNWDEYKDKLIILTNGELSISSITKIEDKSLFFK